jgi:uncharacterized membrane protein YhaH (DUF805 family)
MKFVKSIIYSFNNSLNWRSSASRDEFFYFLIFLLITDIVLVLVHINILESNFIPGDISSPVYEFLYDPSLIFALLTLLPTLSITARRLKDVNQGVWRLALAIIIWMSAFTLLNQNFNLNDSSSNIPYIISAIITFGLLKGVFYQSDDSFRKRFTTLSLFPSLNKLLNSKSLPPNKDSKNKTAFSDQENSIVPPILCIVIAVFSFSWNPQFIYEIEVDNSVNTNPYLTNLKSRNLIDLIGFGDCTHTLQDGTCFTEGSFSIVKNNTIFTPGDMSVASTDGFWNKFIPFVGTVTEVRHVRRNFSASDMLTSCNLDHIEFQGGVNEDMLNLIRSLLNEIYLDPNRCTSNGQPIAIDVYLSSPGGYVYYGNLLAMEMKKFGVTTHITPFQVCASMCTTLFLSGKERIMHADSLLGFHSAYIPSIGKNGFICDRSSQEYIHYFLEEELAAFVASDFLNICNPNMPKILNTGTALTLGLATRLQ